MSKTILAVKVRNWSFDEGGKPYVSGVGWSDDPEQIKLYLEIQQLQHEEALARKSGKQNERAQR